MTNRLADLKFKSSETAFAALRRSTLKDNKMRRLIVSSLVSFMCTVPAAAQVTGQLEMRAAVQDPVTVPKADGQNLGKEGTESIEATLISRLTSAGLTEIEVFPLSFVARAKNADGKPVTLVLYPDENLEWQVAPVDEDDTQPSTPGQ